MLSAISAQSEMRFMVHEGSVTADSFSEILSRQAAGVERKINQVLDGQSIHKAANVQKHLAALNGQITLFFLPRTRPTSTPTSGSGSWSSSALPGNRCAHAAI